MAVNGVNNNTNTQAYRSQPPKKSDAPKNNQALDEQNENVKPGSYNDPKRIPRGLFTKEQLEVLDNLENDPTNQRLKDNQAMGKDAFMHILLTQLANQNPLNPMEDKDFIGQMAQFSALEGMQKMNENFTGLADNFGTLKEGVEAIRQAVGEGSTDKAVIKMNVLLKHIAEKLGVDMAKVEADIKAEADKAEGKDKAEGAEGTEGTEQTGDTTETEGTSETPEANQTQNAENTENGEDVAEAGGTETTEDQADATDKVNEETKKQNADKAYKEA